MRIPFAVPDQVTWNDLSSVLSYWYQSKTGMCLTYDHLQIVAAKLFGKTISTLILLSRGVAYAHEPLWP